MSEDSHDPDTIAVATPAAAAPVARVTRLAVLACALVYVVQLTVVTPDAIASILGFSAATPRWWGVLTFPFAHADTWSLAINAGVLLAFGSLLERRWGSAEYARYLAVCTVGAWATHVAVIDPTATISGAAAPALGVTLAFAVTFGELRHFRVGSLSLSGQGLATVVSALILGVAAAAADVPLRALAHAGGIVAGWAYLRISATRQLQRLRESVQPVPDEPDEMPRAIPKSNPKARRGADDIVAQSRAALASAAATHRPTPTLDARTAAATLNRLLDKISAEGIDSLSNEERRQLDDASRRLRDS